VEQAWRDRWFGGGGRRRTSTSTLGERAMNVGAKLAVAFLPVCILSACATALLALDERKQVCEVRVDETFGAPVYHPNPLSSLVGVAVGAGGGALRGVGTGYPFVGIPLGAAIGGLYGAACSAASASHPDAEANFQKILQAAEAGSLKRAMEAELNVPRAGCVRPASDPPATVEPDTIVEVRKVDVTMGCLFGKQEYWITVDWKVTTAAGSRVLAETTTRCSQKSSRGVDEWFAAPDQARLEVERVLGKVGQRMAEELLSPMRLSECAF
jgi:hypothetical protein